MLLTVQYLRFCLGIQQKCPLLSVKEWQEVYDFCFRHSLLGVGYQGLEKLSSEATIPLRLKYQWIGCASQISNRNKLLNSRCIDLQRMFADAGFATCILKGQGNALMYPNPLLRQSGDIDIWVSGCIRDIVRFLATKCDTGNLLIGYHHTEFPIWKDVEVEVHWRPSWQSSPLYNRRLQRWFKSQAEAQFSHVDEKTGMHVPTWEFNVVYQLQHMFLHVMQEGLGLRQVLDYYYLLSGHTDRADSFERTLRHLGLWKFAGAVMYVLREVFALDERLMIASADERRGTVLLHEILLSGNFGQHDERNGSLRRKTGISRSIARVRRQLRFLRDYPHETLCAPFQIYHVIWRKCRLWRQIIKK